MRPSAVLAALATVIAAVAYIGHLTRRAPEPTKPAAFPVATNKSDDSEHKPPVKVPEPEGEDGPDFHTRNPFEPLKVQKEGNPIATVEMSEFDFGTMVLGGTERHEFTVKNSGTATLKLAKGLVQCKCTSPLLKKGEFPEVAPGATFSIPIEWHPLEKTDSFLKQMTIWTNDPEHPKLVFTINGKVFTALETFPTSVLFQSIPYQSDKEMKVIIGSRIADNFEILEATSATGNVEVTHKRADLTSGEAAAGAATGIKCAHELTVIAKWQNKLGTFNDVVKLKTDCPDGPEYNIEVAGFRAGPFRIESQHFFADEALIRAGRFKAAQGKKLELPFFIEYDGLLEFSDVKSKIKGLKVSLVKDEKFKGTGRQRYVFTVEIPPGSPVEYPNDTPVALVITTNHPLFPELQFALSYRAD